MIFAIVRLRALRRTSPSALLRRASTSPWTRGGYLERTSLEGFSLGGGLFCGDAGAPLDEGSHIDLEGPCAF